jgi:carbonic anhydrase
MKFTKKRNTEWNGLKALPEEIHVIHNDPHHAELELLTMLCLLHGHVTAFDLLMGSEPDTEKDKDIMHVLTAFQQFIAPKMPLSHYTGSEKRMVALSASDKKVKPIDSMNTE